METLGKTTPAGRAKKRVRKAATTAKKTAKKRLNTVINTMVKKASKTIDSTARTVKKKATATAKKKTTKKCPTGTKRKATAKQLANLKKARAARKAKTTRTKKTGLLGAKSVNKSSINLFVSFCFNYPNGFIKKVWKGNDSLIDHLESKFENIYEKHNAYPVMPLFYSELSETNQKKLETWILKNYKG